MIRVALAGPMGAGKTAVGRALAARRGVPFRDLDGEVGDVARIFREEGEAGFRAREAAALARLAQGEGVLSLGGGTVVDPANLTRLAGWQVVVLSARPATLRARLGTGEGRPLAARLEELLVERAEAYRRAGVPVDTEGRTVEEVVLAVEAACGFR